MVKMLPVLLTHLPTLNPSRATTIMPTIRMTDAASNMRGFDAIHSAFGPNAYER